jgi:hypothetical protein
LERWTGPLESARWKGTDKKERGREWVSLGAVNAQAERWVGGLKGGITRPTVAGSQRLLAVTVPGISSSWCCHWSSAPRSRGGATVAVSHFLSLWVWQHTEHSSHTRIGNAFVKERGLCMHAYIHETMLFQCFHSRKHHPFQCALIVWGGVCRVAWTHCDCLLGPKMKKLKKPWFGNPFPNRDSYQFRYSLDNKILNLHDNY